jgi:sulfatase modifying factor 1
MSACCGPARPADTAHTSSVQPGQQASGCQVPGQGLVVIKAGTFQMGSSDGQGDPFDGEGPAHDVDLSAYAVARHTVTNAAFATFAGSTGHTTTAERIGNSFVFAGLLPDGFAPTQGLAAAPWWRLVDGADWRHPEGPQSDIVGRKNHPVVHVSWFDAVAYCQWSGTTLPTEAQWECAARGGINGEHYPWGREREPDGVHLMNVYQGTFPTADTGDDGWVGTCPVGSFPPNGFGLHEMTGNVWEWCSDWFDPSYYLHSPKSEPSGPDQGMARVMRGGSYLCHESYCVRYRVGARSRNAPDSTSGNIGFRVVAMTV